MIWSTILFNLCVGILFAAFLFRAVRRYERRADAIMAKLDREDELSIRKWNEVKDEIRASMRAQTDKAIAGMQQTTQSTFASRGNMLARSGASMGEHIDEAIETIEATNNELAKAHETLGMFFDLIKSMADRGDTKSTSHSATSATLVDPSPSRPQSKCRNYVKFLKPLGMKATTGGPFRVADLCKCYNFPTGLNGNGVIGILELGGGYTQTDLDQFSMLNWLPRIQPIDILVNGGKNRPGDPADAEVLLDIQVTAAAYFYITGKLPTIKVFFSPNTFNAFVAVIEQAVIEGCDVLSISWGADEAAWDPLVAAQVEVAAEIATQRGCAIFAAAGDNSSGDKSLGANVDMPSSCPHIVSCGGTTKSPLRESVWGNGIPDGEGTGGGYSSLFPRPVFQVGIPTTSGSRMVPDVAAAADPQTGYLIVLNGIELPIGGTSAVAPLYSALFAALGQKLGFVTPTLYKNPNAFVDITQGSNGSFQAVPGPDPCTGLGVPDGAALAAHVLSHTSVKTPCFNDSRLKEH